MLYLVDHVGIYFFIMMCFVLFVGVLMARIFGPIMLFMFQHTFFILGIFVALLTGGYFYITS